LKLAKKFGGEIISADSRQVYKGLTIGSGKITKKEMRGIAHHLLDVASPKRKFSVARYQTLALRAIKKIQSGNKIPFLVGGTGFYIQSIVDGMLLPKVAPNWKLRNILAQKNNEELFGMLKKLDQKRAASIDGHNPHRLIRAIEIVTQTKKPIPALEGQTFQFSVLEIGIKKSPVELKKAIHKRLQKRIKGIIAEVKKLHRNGLSWKRLEELGLEYRFVSQYIQGKIDHQEMIDKLQKEIEHFAKRQMTWFKRDKKIHWVKNYREAKILAQQFL